MLRYLLPQIRKVTDIPIVLVQHISSSFTESVARNIQDYSGYQVVVTNRSSIIEPGHLYLAPGGKHLTLARDLKRQLIVKLTDTEPVHSCKPSVDVMLLSAANLVTDDALVMILTGMGNDGAEGAKALKDRGATVLVQDRESSVVWGMPGAAVHAEAYSHILDPAGMAKFIRETLKGKAS